MTALSDAAAVAILHSIWQETAIVVVLLMMLHATRRANAKVRYALSCAALAAMVLLPFATFVDALDGTVPDGTRAVGAANRPVEVEPPLVMADGSRIWTDRPIAPQAILSSLYGWIVPLWLAGVALASVRLVSAAHYVRAVRGSGAPAPPDVMTTSSTCCRWAPKRFSFITRPSGGCHTVCASNGSCAATTLRYGRAVTRTTTRKRSSPWRGTHSPPQPSALPGRHCPIESDGS